MMRVTWSASGAEARLSGVSDALRDLRPVWPEIREITIRFFKARFASQGSYPAGAQWVALNPRYAAQKRRAVGDKPILQFSGDLLESMESGAHHIYRTGPSFMEIGTSDEKARTHQWGYPPRNIPARAIIVKPSKAEGERIVDAILAFIFRAARRPR